MNSHETISNYEKIFLKLWFYKIRKWQYSEGTHFCKRLKFRKLKNHKFDKPSVFLPI